MEKYKIILNVGVVIASLVLIWSYSCKALKMSVKGGSRSTSKKKEILDFGYYFNTEGRLVSLDSGQGFVFKLYDEHVKNQQRYEELGKAVEEFVYQQLEKVTKLKRIKIPFNKKSKGHGFVFASEDYKKSEKLLLIVHGSGVVRAGQWSRRLIINNSMKEGSQIPYIEKALTLGYGVIVLNSNLNYDEEKKTPIPNNETPDKHFNYIWDAFVENSNAKHVAIVAHSYGGAITINEAVHNMKMRSKTFAVAFTDSVHFLRSCKKDVEIWMEKNVCNWVSSDKPLDTPLKSYHCLRVSAGTPVHEETSYKAFNSVWKFIEDKFHDKIKMNTLVDCFEKDCSVTVAKDDGVVGTAAKDDGYVGTAAKDDGYVGTAAKDDGVVGTAAKDDGVVGTAAKDDGVVGTAAKDDGYVGTEETTESISGVSEITIDDNEKGGETERSATQEKGKDKWKEENVWQKKQQEYCAEKNNLQESLTEGNIKPENDGGSTEETIVQEGEETTGTSNEWGSDETAMEEQPVEERGKGSDTEETSVLENVKGGGTDKTAVEEKKNDGGNDETAVGENVKSGGTVETAAKERDKGGDTDETTVEENVKGVVDDETAKERDNGGATNETAVEESVKDGATNKAAVEEKKKGGGNDETAGRENVKSNGTVKTAVEENLKGGVIDKTAVEENKQGGGNDETAVEENVKSGGTPETAAKERDKGGDTEETAVEENVKEGVNDESSAKERDKGDDTEETTVEENKQGGGNDETAVEESVIGGATNKTAVEEKKKGGGNDETAGRENVKSDGTVETAVEENVKRGVYDETAAKERDKGDDTEETAVEENKQGGGNDETAVEKNVRSGGTVETAMEENVKSGDSDEIAAMKKVKDGGNDETAVERKDKSDGTVETPMDENVLNFTGEELKGIDMVETDNTQIKVNTKKSSDVEIKDCKKQGKRKIQISDFFSKKRKKSSDDTTITKLNQQSKYEVKVTCLSDDYVVIKTPTGSDDEMK